MPTVTDDPARGRFELRDGEELLGWLDYRPAGASVIIAHTEIASAHERQGLGGVLVGAALDELRSRGTTVIPMCPFTAAFIQRHPEYVDVIDPSFRGRFG